jgi:putative oxidoreductase
MKADALIRFMVLGNRSWEEFALLLARISLGAFFAISGGNKLFVAAHTREIYETIAAAGIPFSHVMAYFVSSVEFICGSLLIIGLLSSLCCIALIFDMIVAIATVQLAAIAKGLSFSSIHHHLHLADLLRAGKSQRRSRDRPSNCTVSWPPTLKDCLDYQWNDVVRASTSNKMFFVERSICSTPMRV